MIRVLIVEDNEQVAAVCREALEAAGYEVGIAPDGQAAVLSAEHDGIPDLIVMDLALAGVSGVVVACAIRYLGFDGPLVAATGNLLTVDEALYARARFTGRLLKPFKMTELVAEVDRQLQKTE